jgi:spermidine synthase
MCQPVWMHSRSQHQIVIRTFLQVFPHVTLMEDGTLLIGSNQPIRISRAAVARKFAHPQTRSALIEAGFDGVEAVLKLHTGTREEIRAYAGDGPVITEDRPLVEYSRSSHQTPPVVE